MEDRARPEPSGIARRIAPPGQQTAACPADVERSRLYTPADLYDTPSYADSFDARAYAFARRPAARGDALARALHDHAIDRALADWVADRSIVGVMGGHAIQRDEPAYAEAARLAHGLGGHHVVATGGGPGAMEAANLGARLAGLGTDALSDALDRLARVPSFADSIDAWVEPALAVAAQTEAPRASLGIPTWHYGHEPPNVFATAIAKYFRNATREAILLEVCNAGIIFLPGAAGTVQEIFQDACENYYADPADVAPMVLLGRSYWTETLAVWPLLEGLARGRTMAPHVHLVDDAEEAIAIARAGISRPA